MEEVFRFPNQTLEIGGKYYWNVYSIYEHFLKCLTDLGKRHIPLDSIGIDTWGVDFGCIGHDGTLLGLPRAYRDPYTEGIPEKFYKIVPHDELYALTGIQIMNFNTVFQMFAQAEEGSVAYQHAKRILFMPDLLSYMLTRGKVCESTIASTSGLVNPKTQQFEPSLMAAVGLRQDQLPDRVQAGETVGRLRYGIAKDTGLGEVPVVAVAGHDTASAIVAVPAENEHFAYLSSGTWSLMGIEVGEPIINGKSAQLNFTNEGGIEGTTRFLKNITGMWLVEQCRKKWMAQGKDYTYTQMTEMAASAKAYAGRVLPTLPTWKRKSITPWPTMVLPFLPTTQNYSAASTTASPSVTRKCLTCCKRWRRSKSRSCTSSAEARPTPCSINGPLMPLGCPWWPVPPKPLPSAT